jgi:hypothetical protein
MSPAKDAASQKLDELIAVLSRCKQWDQFHVVAEHIESARLYLDGAMISEYEVNLAMIRDAIASAPEPAVRSEAAVILGKLETMAAQAGARGKR